MREKGRVMKQGFIIGLGLLVCSSYGWAEPIKGTFSASLICPAYKSIKKQDNPENVMTEVAAIYPVVAENKPGGNWLLLEFPNQDPKQRWVSRSCGIVSINTHAADKESLGMSEECHVANTYDSYVLSMSWQAGFCEHVNYRGTKAECDHLNNGTLSVSNLTIHGLWPNKSECGIHYDSCATTPLNLRDETVKAISPWMPNFYYSTDFGSHEWLKHGTCQALDDDSYFMQMKQLVEKFDQSELGNFIRHHLAQEVKTATMKNDLAKVMGKEVVDKIQLSCSGRVKKYLSEIRIQLPKSLNVDADIPQLVSGAKTVDSFAGNCGKQFYVEAPGIQ